LQSSVITNLPPENHPSSPQDFSHYNSYLSWSPFKIASAGISLNLALEIS
jgi:hypothetical protein